MAKIMRANIFSYRQSENGNDVAAMAAKAALSKTAAYRRHESYISEIGHQRIWRQN